MNTNQLTITYIRADLLQREQYQRPLKTGPKSMLRSGNGWDPSICAPCVVAAVGNQYYVIDGQHRQALAMRSPAGGATQLPCVVRHGLIYQERARLFQLLNGTPSKPNAVEMTLAAVESGEPQAVAIIQALIKRGLRLGLNGSRGYVRCPDVLKRAHSKGVLETILDVATGWRDGTGSEHALSSRAFKAILSFSLQFPGLSSEELTRKLKRHSPESLLVQIAAAAKQTGDSFDAAAAIRLGKIYDSRIKKA